MGDDSLLSFAAIRYNISRIRQNAITKKKKIEKLLKSELNGDLKMGMGRLWDGEGNGKRTWGG